MARCISTVKMLCISLKFCNFVIQNNELMTKQILNAVVYITQIL